jgi:hypothetical protein
VVRGVVRVMSSGEDCSAARLGGGGLLRREAGAEAGGQGHAGGQNDAGQIDRQRPVMRHLSLPLLTPDRTGM